MFERLMCLVGSGLLVVTGLVIAALGFLYQAGRIIARMRSLDKERGKR